MSCDLDEYAFALHGAPNLETAFSLLEEQASQLGFDGALYTYIPSIIVNSEVTSQPVYQVSNDYAPAYLTHYQQARFDRHDPLIGAVRDGCNKPINWAGEICESYKQQDKRSREVIDAAGDYGIANGITLPLMCSAHGIAGASFITHQRGAFDKLLDERLEELKLVAGMYSNFVLANTGYIGSFVKPVFSNLNKLEIRLLAGLALGKSPAEIASDLCRSEKYLEQVMLKVRRKVSGVEGHERPTINRNQLLYYAGLVNIIGHAENL